MNHDMATSTITDRAEQIIRSRAEFRPSGEWFVKSPEAEGGCGVTGFACTIPVGGKHIYEPSIQMRNRGNGKGGGIAACGLVPEDLGVSHKVLDEDYIIQVALLDPSARNEVEKTWIEPYFDIDQGGMVPTVDDYRDVPLLEVKPPDVARYFVRVKPQVLAQFADEKNLQALSDRDVEDEFVYQNSLRLNTQYYASLGDKRAFVMSHARNLIILKIVGYAEAAVQYYRMPDTRAHVWIAHQRYPTKGRVWHPGGASIHRAQRGPGPQRRLCQLPFGVRVPGRAEHLPPVFDRYRSLGALVRPLEPRIQVSGRIYYRGLGPYDRTRLRPAAPEKQRIYRQIQACHIHASPDGPWFFIIARSLTESKSFQLLGITDTGNASAAGICTSGRRSIDRADLLGKAGHRRYSGQPCRRGPAVYPCGRRILERPRRQPYRRRRVSAYRQPGKWESRDFRRKSASTNGRYDLRVTNKFGVPVATLAGQSHCNLSVPPAKPANTDGDFDAVGQAIEKGDPFDLFQCVCGRMEDLSYDHLRLLVDKVAQQTAEKAPALGIDAFTLALDRRYATGNKKRSSVLTILRGGLEQILERHPICGDQHGGTHARITWQTRNRLRGPESGQNTLLIDARAFSPEGENCDAALAIKAFRLGWRHIIHYNSRGTRFHGVGFGPNTEGLRIDCYDNPGDYLGSGIDGLEIYVHCNAQDQLCQIAKRGKLVVYGDVGQTFLYGAKGGEIYVLGNAAGRPMINAVGRPRVVINGTALDFLAESFMAGDPRTGGGFAIVNGLQFDQSGKLVPLDLPYPGSNLLSLASGGAIYVRDPHQTLVDEQLNAGAYRSLSGADWKLMLPYLEENQRLFGIRIQEDLLTVDGTPCDPKAVYRKVMPRKDAEIEAELEGMGE